MKVLHVDTARSWRGGQNQVLLTAAGMAARGHDVLVAARAGGELESRVRDRGLGVEPMPFSGDLAPGSIWALRKLMRRFRPDVVQLHDPHAVSAGVLAGWGTAAPLVATRRVDFHLRSALSLRKYERCARVVAVSEAIASILRSDHVDERLLRVVHEGVPDRAARDGGREVLAEAGVPSGAQVVGNVAALTDHKDHLTLLQAFARVGRDQPDAWLVILGEGELRASLEARARALGLDRCRFLGFRRDVDVVIPAFDVFCLTSHQEGLGTSLLDAMCFGRPVVATTAGGIPEAVDDGITGLLAPVRDPDALAQRLGALLGDPERARRMGDAGRRRFEERFTDGAMVDATLAVYGEVA